LEVIAMERDTTGTPPPADTNTGFAPLVIRRAEEIYGIDGGWFQARWHFSFDQYHDPAHMGIGRLRVFNHDTLVPGAVWPMHPHRDVEGITYVLAGEFEHADSLGNGGVLLPGGVQRMRLGRGAQHSERNHSRTAPMQFLQLWILPATRGLTPRNDQRQYSAQDRHNRLLRVLRPEHSEGEEIDVAQDASVYVARLDPGVTVEERLAPGHGGYVYLIEGAADLGGERLVTGDAAYLPGDGLVRVRANQPSELLLVDTPL
jgi:redox-sensitive bicupin YhaK (pirin superfamily)